MPARKQPPAAPAVGGDRPDFEVVGDHLVCHPYDDLRLSLVISMSAYQRFLEIADAATTWAEQTKLWRDEVMPASVVEAIDQEAEKDFAAAIQLSTQWARGLDVRLGKALS